MRSKRTLLPLLLLAALLLSACAGNAGTPAGEGPAASAQPSPDHTVITFSGSEVQILGGGARDEGDAVVISAAGTYEVTGVSQDKALIVDTGDDAMDVTLILNNAEIASLTGPALHIRQAKHFRLQLAAGSVSRLTSGTEEQAQAASPDASGAALYSEDDMDIEGEGRLIVCGYLNNGIGCKDDLDINSGEIVVVAVNNGVKGNDSVQIKGGSLTVTAWGDGVKSSTADKAGKGAVEISGGSVRIECWGDGIQAATQLRVTGGELSVKAQGQGDEQSSKALKAGGDIALEGGQISLESQEDGLRSETGSVRLCGASLEILAAGDGIQAGEKGSGLGDVVLESGTVRIDAGKQAVKARGSFTVTGGSLTALCGSGKQAGPEGELPWLLCPIAGSAGDEIAAGDLPALTARRDFSCLLLADGALPRGEVLPVSCGTAQIEAQVR
ncbi:MAG: carbohydrate-binding domain-containing protein [Oscillospiraceae bacterium]|nr:carbohydrate-binding domain-containing protein [Oscillospiraceae bacterium]